MWRVSKTYLVSKLREVSSLLVIVMVVGAALWTIARDWNELLAVGGWFAVLGRFMAVVTTVTLLVLLVLLAFGLIIAPVLLLLVATNALGERDYVPRGDVAHLCAGLRPRQLGLRLVRAVNPFWKALWWAWWYLNRCLRGRIRRG